MDVELNMKLFMELVEEVTKERKSILCVGLDPALPNQRKINTIPERYLKDGDDAEARLNFCLDIIGEVAEFCSAIKINEQYVKGFNVEQHKILVKEAADKGLISIYDLKLGDIGESVNSAFFHIRRWGYNAVTVNPLPGNLIEIVKKAREKEPNIGVLTLTLMSNPEALKYFKKSKIDGKPLYLAIAEEVKASNGDGCVIGIAEHVTENEIRKVREIVGGEKVILFPGIGAQKGDPEKAAKAGGENILINVGRAIIYSRNPKEKAKEYNNLFNSLRKLQ